MTTQPVVSADDPQKIRGTKAVLLIVGCALVPASFLLFLWGEMLPRGWRGLDYEALQAIVRLVHMGSGLVLVAGLGCIIYAVWEAFSAVAREAQQPSENDLP